jgi:hypothetical protein
MLMLNGAVSRSANGHASRRQSVDQRLATLSARANLDRSVGAEVAQIFRATNLQTDGSRPRLSRADDFAETDYKGDVDSHAPKNRTNFRGIELNRVLGQRRADEWPTQERTTNRRSASEDEVIHAIRMIVLIAVWAQDNPLRECSRMHPERDAACETFGVRLRRGDGHDERGERDRHRDR